MYSLTVRHSAWLQNLSPLVALKIHDSDVESDQGCGLEHHSTWEKNGKIWNIPHQWTGWWFGTIILFFHILGISSSQLTFIFFRGVKTNQMEVYN